MNQWFKTSLFLILGGAIALFAGIFFTVIGQNQTARDTEPATAVVVEYVEGEEYDSTSSTNNIVYYPVVTYEAAGKEIRSQYSQYEYSQIYEIGSTIDIKYNPDDPEEFYIVEDSSRLKFGTIWEIPLGIVLILVGLGRILVPIVRAAKK